MRNHTITTHSTEGKDDMARRGMKLGAALAVVVATAVVWAPNAFAPPPGLNDFSFGKVAKNKREGTAKLTVKVAHAPGYLWLASTKDPVGPSGSERQPGRGVKSARARVGATATARLPIRPSRNAKEKLNETGEAKVTAEVTYSSEVGERQYTQSKKIKLIKR